MKYLSLIFALFFTSVVFAQILIDDGSGLIDINPIDVVEEVDAAPEHLFAAPRISAIDTTTSLELGNVIISDPVGMEPVIVYTAGSDRFYIPFDRPTKDSQGTRLTPNGAYSPTYFLDSTCTDSYISPAIYETNTASKYIISGATGDAFWRFFTLDTSVPPTTASVVYAFDSIGNCGSVNLQVVIDFYPSTLVASYPNAVMYFTLVSATAAP